ncbi:DoxX family membrane protein [Micromonospora cathayae]|uniref:DoxX family membrane protein n=1 Tax=Micromonospora cathayae TaxID=3028804 RepID=A0ABY7ZMA5_9ACTN|nr:DoxX family membrane protein [Micromonospora sp. HUAS 3]WDZ83034.1 DoxX family membrane protein [Micromonospora sp. HUAS 3]
MDIMTATIERNTARTTTPAAPTATRTNGVPVTGTTRTRAARYVFAGIRIALGWTFLWAFLDKTFGLGHATEAKNAWINGGSPTKGFLAFGAEGPFQGFYQGIAGAAWADWLFMAGLLGLGVALLLGIGMRIAAVAGGLLYVMMWTVVLPPENNPFMDEHLINAALLAGLALVAAGDTLGLGRAWAKLPIVQRLPWLR